MSNLNYQQLSSLGSSKIMKLMVVSFITACLLTSKVDAKPIFPVKFVPILYPKADIFGAVGHVLGLKAALLGHTLKTKANILHKIANIKGGLGALLTSSLPQGHTHATVVNPGENVVLVKETTYQPPLSLSYGVPPPVIANPSLGAPYPA